MTNLKKEIEKIILSKGEQNEQHFDLFVQDTVKELLTLFADMDTARVIGGAASEAGLVPKDLANPEDWKEALAKIIKEPKRKGLPKNER